MASGKAGAVHYLDSLLVLDFLPSAWKAIPPRLSPQYRDGSTALQARENGQPRRDGVVELDQDDERKPERHAGEADERAQRVERLGDDDPPPKRAQQRRRRVFPKQFRPFGIGPSDVNG